MQSGEQNSLLQNNSNTIRNASLTIKTPHSEPQGCIIFEIRVKYSIDLKTDYHKEWCDYSRMSSCFVRVQRECVLGVSEGRDAWDSIENM